MKQLKIPESYQQDANGVEEYKLLMEDFSHLARLSGSESYDDIRLFLARLVRKYRSSNPDFASQIEKSLRGSQMRSSSTLRRIPPPPVTDLSLPFDAESRLSLIKVYDDRNGIDEPILSANVQKRLDLIIRAREQCDILRSSGICPTRSAIFTGKPGVGKTLTARWLAYKLKRPLWVLDLTAVMSSFLGKTGNNLRAAIDYAKEHQAILLLDEIDSIAKRRDDFSDVGELKRLVTVMLQEIDQWPDTGLLLAATNHPDLIDPALWRRFDSVVEFGEPDHSSVIVAVNRFLGQNLEDFYSYIPLLVQTLNGLSFSNIERAIHDLRRAHLLENESVLSVVENFVSQYVQNLNRSERLDLAITLGQTTSLSQHEIHRLTGVARDTIRKHSVDTDIQGSKKK